MRGKRRQTNWVCGNEVNVAEWCIEIVDMFLEFVGSGWIHWLLAAAVLVAGSIKSKYFRHEFLYPAVIILIVFFCPPVYGIIGIRFMNGMYWRMLWLIPINVIIAYGAVKICAYLKNYFAKALALAALTALIALSGKPIFDTANFYPAQNLYQLPQITIDTADAIIEELTNDYARPIVVVPDEMLCSLRQYTTRLRLLYGRNAYSYIFSELPDMEATVHNEMVKAAPDMEKLAVYAKAKNVEYIVFNLSYHTGIDRIEGYGYKYLKSVSGYGIYVRSE